MDCASTIAPFHLSSERGVVTDRIELSIVTPWLNEARTVGTCVEKTHRFLAEHCRAIAGAMQRGTACRAIAAAVATSILIASPVRASEPVPRVSITSDAPIVAGGTATIRFRIEAPPSALAAGDTIEIRFPICAPWARTRWTTAQLSDPEKPGFVVIHGAARVEIAQESSEAAALRAATSGPGYPQAIRVLFDGGAAAESSVVVVYGEPGASGAGRAIAQLFPEEAAEWRPVLRPRANGSSTPEVTELPAMTLPVGRAAFRRLHLSSASQVRAGESFEVRAAALDSLGFPAASFPEDARLRAMHESGKELAAPSLGAAGVDACTRTASFRFEEPGIVWIEVVHDESRPAAWSAPWALPVRVDESVRDASADWAPERRLVFGDLHWHTDLSDGSRSPREGYAYARDVVGLDFTALTDHDVHLGFPSLDEKEWSAVEDLAREWEEPGRFASLPGWEYTAGVGHMVVLHRSAEGPYRRVSDFPEPARLWDALIPGETITILAHPAGGGLVPFVKLDALDSRFVLAAEVFSSHGCAESPDAKHLPERLGGRGEGARVRGTVQEFLARGNRFAFLASTDNHTATPGNPIRHTRREITAGTGLTGAWVDALSREGVFDAIAAGRVYATTGPRIRIEVSVIGGEIVGLVAGSAPLASVEIVGVRTGAELPFPVIDSIPVQGRLARFRRELPASFDEVYLRVTQSDTEMAWSSPFWISKDR